MLIYFYTFGCKVNQYETEILKQAFERHGHIAVPEPDKADFCVINTCTVTARSDLKLKQFVRKIRRINPRTGVALVGCYAQVAEDDLGADVIIGTDNKELTVGAVEKFVTSGEKTVERSLGPGYKEGEALKYAGAKTRGIIKIQDGCDRFCSYCIIPYARGRSRSKALENIRAEAKTLTDGGVGEIVLVGINLSDYGRGLGIRLPDAVRAAAEFSGRIRLGSLEPEELNEDIIEELSAISALCPHFHLALQSGCDRTLKQMRRKYDSTKYMSIADSLRRHFPGCALTTDVMVGFPGESQSDFYESLNFVKQIGFTKVHVFPYSAREGTPAAKRSDQVPEKIKEERACLMSKAAEDGALAYQKKLIGTVQSVLFEREKSPDYHQGHARNYQIVRVNHFTDTLFRELRDVKITELKDGYLWGEIV